MLDRKSANLTRKNEEIKCVPIVDDDTLGSIPPPLVLQSYERVPPHRRYCVILIEAQGAVVRTDSRTNESLVVNTTTHGNRGLTREI
jgi:hypothetical protein